MKNIKADYIFGLERQTCEVSRNDWGTGNYGVYINNYFQGELFYKDGHWQCYTSKNSELTSADITIIGEMIEAQLASEGLTLENPG